MLIFTRVKNQNKEYSIAA